MNQFSENNTDVFERITDAFVALDNDWCFTYMNKKAGEILGLVPQQVVGKNLWTELPEGIDLPFYKALHRAMKEQQYVHIEDYYAPYNRWFENHIYPSAEGLSVFFRDITDRKRDEETIKASEKRLALIYNTIYDIVFLISVEEEERFRFQSVNRSFLSATGLKQEQVEGKYIEDVIPEPSRSLVLNKYREAIQTRQLVQWEEISEYPTGRKTGIVSVTPVFNDMSECTTLVGAVHDVTQMKKAEEKLIRANRLYAFISQINQMIVHTTDKETLFKEACEIAIRIGKFRMAWIGMIDKEIQKVIPVMHAGEDQDCLSKITIISVNDMAEGRGPTGTAIKEGRYIFCNNIEKDPSMAPWKEAALGRGYLSSISLPIKKFGKVVGVFTLYADTKNFFDAEEISLLEETTSDISFALEIFEKDTLRKKAEEAVLQSEKRYQTLAETSPVGIFHTDASGYTTYVNSRWCQISGLTREEALGYGWLNAVYKEDRNELVKGWQEATMSHKFSSSEYRFVRSDGTITWVMGQATPERNPENQIVGYVGTTTDITERKKAEEEIAKIYKEKEIVLNRIDDGVVSVDNEWRYTFLNDAALSTHPLGKEETIGKTIWEVHPEMKGTVFWDKYHEAMETKKTVEVENYYAPMDVWFSVNVYPSDDGLTIFYRNITERKKIENEILKEKHLSESIINSLPGIFYLYEENGKFIRWNKNFETISGYSRKEISQMHPLDFFDGDEKILLKERIEKVFEKGVADVEAHFFTKSKKRIPYYFNGWKVVFDDKPCLIGVGIDTSERKKAEKEILEMNKQLRLLSEHLQKIREEERTSMAREIHDELGQQLTVMKMDVSWLHKKMEKKEETLRQRMEQLRDMLDQTVVTVRRIASELRPSILDDMGLAAAIEWHLSEFGKRFGIKTEFNKMKKELPLPDAVKTGLFRILQESLTNVGRYAKAKKVTVRLQQEDGQIVLTIKDNGVGFDKEKVAAKKTLGILGMRERAVMLRGSYEINSTPGKGATVIVTVPLGE